mgnify:FL=1
MEELLYVMWCAWKEFGLYHVDFLPDHMAGSRGVLHSKGFHPDLK